MAHLYFPKYAITIFYLTLVIYLYGDLAIYITVVSKSIRDVVCAKNNSMSCTDFFTPQLDPEGAYRLFCILFIMTIGPFAFLNISKTKYLQMTTTLFRWTAFTAMIVLAIIRISGEEVSVNPTKANLSQLPSLFGVCIYSFMCHHSLPSLVTPIRNKQSVNLLFALDYLLIAVFYIFLAVTGVFAFSTVKDVYTLNFIDVKYVNVLLPLFPVATLSTNFPIISITLKNNLKTLFGFESDFSNIFYTLLAILPPFLVSVFISDVTFLVNVTGSFAGVGIQYVIPTMVVYLARRKVGENCLNPFASPFRGDLWIYLVLGWSSLAVVLVVWHMLFN